MSANANRVHRSPVRPVRLAAAACLLVLVAAGAAAAATAQGDGGILFSLARPDAGAVSLVGDFNGWNPDATPLVKGKDGVWSVTVSLPPGAQPYRFVVDGEWVEDPDNAARQADPLGGFNSVVTVANDGTLVSATPAAGQGGARPAAAAGGETKAGPPRAVEGGVLFSYDDGGARQVFLAGDFNSWSATATPMVRGDNGVWSVTVKLETGRHTYKFVVDGNWQADPLNGAKEDDGYGGSNSVVVVDAQGKVTAAAAAPAAAKAGIDFSSLNGKVTLSGRYLTRFELMKNIQDDPRYRLQRPSMSADLNFDVDVNANVDAYMRLRTDSNDNVILNDVSANMDEAEMHVHPGAFDVRAYWNREIFTSSDPLRLVGDQDLPGTPGYDHLRYGKGTAGALVHARPFGCAFEGFFANVHNYDYYNDPNLFDNTGEDRIYVRLSRRIGPVEVGVPAFLQRELLWLNFGSLVGGATTGLPSLDDFLNRYGDRSDWFETELHNYKAGGDASLTFRDGTMKLGAQAMHVDILQRFVTGNRTGLNDTNGSIDVPFLERSATLAALRWDWTPDEQTHARLQHTWQDQRGATPDQRLMLIGFVDQSVADNKVYFSIAASPAETRSHLTEIEAHRSAGDLDLGLWAWYAATDQDFGPVGRTVPGDSTRTANTAKTWYVSGSAGAGDAATGPGRGELEYAVTLHDPDAGGGYYRSYEFIGRARRGVSRSVTAIADVRYIRFAVDAADPATGDVAAFREGFWSPFVGLEYKPIPTLDLVLGYGVDPVDFSIDYSGRQLGRWWFRQHYLFAHPDATELDAERYLADARVFTLRAQMTF